MIATMLLPILLATPPAEPLSLRERVGLRVEPRITRRDAIGIVVGIWRDGKTDVFGFGRPSLAPGRDAPPDGRTLFEIGSVTKVFTGIALADMAREGLVRADDPVARYLPLGARVPDREGRAITLRSLSQHTSGLARITPKVFARSAVGRDPYAESTEADLLSYLAESRLRTTPGSTYAYSNTGAGLLGQALSRRSGVSYEELIESRICRPLGLADTKVTLTDRDRARLADPYLRGGKPAKPWEFGVFAGAGAIKSTADDMLKFARASLGDVPSSTPEHLRVAMLDARVPGPKAGGPSTRIGLGWHIDKGPSGELDWHNGGTGGFRSFLAIDAARRFALVVLANSDAEVDSIANDLLIDLLDLDKTPQAPTPDPGKSSQSPQPSR